ncbi:MAG: STAS domain-containing protein [Sphaerochaeta sp.]|nr:STAS domain-containing protein [Sphaerochaeta sp.]
MLVTKKDQVTILEIEFTMLTATNAKEFKAKLEKAIEHEKYILLDLNRVTFIDSSGLGVFLFCLKSLNQKGGDLKICNITKPVRVLFELVRLHQVIEVFNSQQEALQAFDQE